MRNISFRGKDKDGQWYHGIPADGGGPILPETLGESTGCAAYLPGGESVELYEGDIVRTDDGKVYAVEFYAGAFRLVTAEEKAFLDKGEHPYFEDYRFPPVLDEMACSYYLELVGNIHDTPGLLKQGADGSH